MIDQFARDATAARIGMGGKGRVGDMRSAGRAVRADMAGPQDATVQNRDEPREGGANQSAIASARVTSRGMQ